MGAIGIAAASDGSAMKYFGQFIDWITPILAFGVFVMSESVVVYYFLKYIGIVN